MLRFPTLAVMACLLRAVAAIVAVVAIGSGSVVIFCKPVFEVGDFIERQRVGRGQTLGVLREKRYSFLPV